MLCCLCKAGQNDRRFEKRDNRLVKNFQTLATVLRLCQHLETIYSGHTNWQLESAPKFNREYDKPLRSNWSCSLC